MKRLDKTESPIFVVLCVLCFQRQALGYSILLHTSTLTKVFDADIFVRFEESGRDALIRRFVQAIQVLTVK